MLKICTYLNALNALFTARFLSGLGVKGYPPPPRYVDKTYILKSPSRRASSFAVLFALSVLFLSLSPTPAKALPEGLKYCHQDGNGQWVSSNLTITPPDVPTALCKQPPTATYIKNNLIGTFYDEAYVDDVKFSNNVQGIEGFLLSDYYTQEDIKSFGGVWPNLALISDIVNMPNNNNGISSNNAGSPGVRVEPVNPFRTAYSQRAVVFVAGGANVDNPYVDFDFGANTKQTSFIAIAMFAGSDRATENIFTPLTHNLSITDTDGNTVNVQWQGSMNSFQQPFVNGKIQQPTIEWEAFGDAEIAHITNIPGSMYKHPTAQTIPRQLYVMGVIFPSMNVASMRITLGENLSTITPAGTWLSYVQNIYFFDDAKLPEMLEEVFPLPEGCVVPTPV